VVQQQQQQQQQRELTSSLSAAFELCEKLSALGLFIRSRRAAEYVFEQSFD
jgi:hypothetical protein